MFICDMYIHRRKQCLHCGCARSTHNVESDPFSVIPLLEELSVGQKSSKLTRADVDRLAKYAWYPPGVSYGMVRYLLPYVYNLYTGIYIAAGFIITSIYT